MSSETVTERRNCYVGETTNQLRDGYGVYFYANKFFRYEGDWVKGRKHGHGKLIMADGSYYEGEFKDGEIEGHGFRKWQHNGNSYSGEFSKGEMHGHGVMNYADGSQYQGEFYRNLRHGTGILRSTDMDVYEGAWYKNKKHGQGIQTFSNGDEYEGDWVEGHRHGQGELTSVEGTTYEGQWRADSFNGQGVLVHVSGYVYEGLWINGLPATEPVEISVKQLPGQKYIEVPQGKKFTVQFQLLDSDREPISGEHGREFKVSAGYKFSQSVKATHSQSLLELIEDIEAKPVPTPFGYDVLPYPIVENVKEFEEAEEALAKKKTRQSPSASRVFGSDTIHESKETVTDTLKADDMDNQDDAEASSTLSGSKYATSELNLELTEEVVDDESGLNSIRLLPPPAPQRSSSDGIVEFQDLLLPIAPVNYRPFLQEDENKRSKGSRTTSAASSSNTSITEGKPAKIKVKVTDVDEKGAKQGKGANRKKPGKEPKTSKPHRKSANKRGSTMTDAKVVAPSTVAKEEDEPDPFFELMNCLYAREGDYVVIVEEITHPPFLGKLLPPAFAVVKVTAPRKPAKKSTAKKAS